MIVMNVVSKSLFANEMFPSPDRSQKGNLGSVSVSILRELSKCLSLLLLSYIAHHNIVSACFSSYLQHGLLSPLSVAVLGL